MADLVRACHERPARMTPQHLEPLRAVAGEAALDYVAVIGAFHFVNRIADLLHVDSEFVPEAWSRIGLLRRVSVFVGTHLMGRMDLANRRYEATFEQACREMEPVFERATGRALAGELEPLRARPKLVEILRLALQERDAASSLPRATIARIYRLVEEYLPACAEDAEGFHRRPSGALEAFVFVGTRYPARTTLPMIEALRSLGYDDVGILDLATAVADANQWARMHRLLALPRDILFPAAEVRPTPPASTSPQPAAGSA